MTIIKIASLAIFTICYITIIYKMFFSKNTEKITFTKTIRTYQPFLIIFTFILITNFNPWYLIWIFPTIMWQKSNNIQTTLALSLGALTSYAITYATAIDDETVGIAYLLLTTLPAIIVNLKKIKVTGTGNIHMQK